MSPGIQIDSRFLGKNPAKSNQKNQKFTTLSVELELHPQKPTANRVLEKQIPLFKKKTSFQVP